MYDEFSNNQLRAMLILHIDFDNKPLSELEASVIRIELQFRRLINYK